MDGNHLPPTVDQMDRGSAAFPSPPPGPGRRWVGSVIPQKEGSTSYLILKHAQWATGLGRNGLICAQLGWEGRARGNSQQGFWGPVSPDLF